MLGTLPVQSWRICLVCMGPTLELLVLSTLFSGQQPGPAVRFVAPAPVARWVSSYALNDPPQRPKQHHVSPGNVPWNQCLGFLIQHPDEGVLCPGLGDDTMSLWAAGVPGEDVNPWRTLATGDGPAGAPESWFWGGSQGRATVGTFPKTSKSWTGGLTKHPPSSLRHPDLTFFLHRDPESCTSSGLGIPSQSSYERL